MTNSFWVFFGAACTWLGVGIGLVITYFLARRKRAAVPGSAARKAEQLTESLARQVLADVAAEVERRIVEAGESR